MDTHVSAQDVRGLFYDVKVSVGLPILGFMMALINIGIRRSKHRILEVGLSLLFVLLFFCVFFVTLMYQDRLVLLAMWRVSPVIYTLLYGACLLLLGLILAGLTYWKLRPELWKHRDETL